MSMSMSDLTGLFCLGFLVTTGHTGRVSNDINFDLWKFSNRALQLHCKTMTKICPPRTSDSTGDGLLLLRVAGEDGDTY